MKLQLQLGLAILAMALAAASSPAQTFEINVAIPFQFTVGEQTLPAGQYNFSSGVARGVVGIWNKDTNKIYAATFQPGYVGRRPSEADAVLVFQRYGEAYFLSEIRNGMNATAYSFPEAKLESEHRKAAGRAPGAVLTILPAPSR